MFFRGKKHFPPNLSNIPFKTVSINIQSSTICWQNWEDNHDIVVVTPHTQLCRGDWLKLRCISGVGLHMATPAEQDGADLERPKISICLSGPPHPSVINEFVFIFCIPGFYRKFCLKKRSDLKSFLFWSCSLGQASGVMPRQVLFDTFLKNS